MLEFVVTAWLLALAVTASLFVIVLFVQGVVRQLARLTKALRPAARVHVADEPVFEASAYAA